MAGPIRTEVPQPELPITPDSLKAENLSPKAIHNISEWRKAKEAKNGQLDLIILCSDARLSSVMLFDNKNIASVSSIAANGETDPFKYLLNNDAIGRVIVISHYDGEKANKENLISGCGGMGARANMGKGKQVDDASGLTEFISKIESSDTLQQTLVIVEKIARLTDKPIFGTAVDHLSYQAHPLVQVVTENGVRKIIYNSELQKPASERKETIPLIPEDQLDPRFKHLLEENKAVVQRLSSDTRFSENQKIQNPKAIFLSTSLLPLALRYPETFSKPNTGFVVRLPFSKNQIESDMEDLQQGKTTITKKFLREVTAQIKYPIDHALKAKKGDSFFDTKTLIIETPSIELSAEIAHRLVTEQQFFRDWITKCGGKIIIAEIGPKNKLSSRIQFYSPDINTAS